MVFELSRLWGSEKGAVVIADTPEESPAAILEGQIFDAFLKFVDEEPNAILQTNRLNEIKVGDIIDSDTIDVAYWKADAVSRGQQHVTKAMCAVSDIKGLIEELEQIDPDRAESQRAHYFTSGNSYNLDTRVTQLETGFKESLPIPSNETQQPVPVVQ